jgi:hypothetical protein
MDGRTLRGLGALLEGSIVEPCKLLPARGLGFRNAKIGQFWSTVVRLQIRIAIPTSAGIALAAVPHLNQQLPRSSFGPQANICSILDKLTVLDLTDITLHRDRFSRMSFTWGLGERGRAMQGVESAIFKAGGNRIALICRSNFGNEKSRKSNAT